MNILFFKPEMAWPRQSGHDVHTFYMMRALGGLGARVGLVTARTPPEAAVAGLDLGMLETLDHTASGGSDAGVCASRLEERFRSYYGVSRADIHVFARLAADFDADAVVVSGLGVLPVLLGVSGALRIWYAADEWVWHHLSQVRLLAPASWMEIRAAAVKGIYERAYRARIDRAWVVSDADASAMRWLAGVANVDVVPNGVDPLTYARVAAPGEPDTAVFWGRLDFGPNIQALQWFAHRVWPKVLAQRPAAKFTIVGFNPTEPVELLARLPGIEIRPNVADDLPSEVARHAVTVLPFVSGGGIKNKLLEAAAMGRAIVCTRRARIGLKGVPPLRVAGTPDDWTRTLCELWGDQRLRVTLGGEARSWVEREHTWESAARDALRAIRSQLA